MIPTYVVNYKDNSRRQRMLHRLRTVGLYPRFSSGISTQDIPAKYHDCGLDLRSTVVMLDHLDNINHFLKNTSYQQAIFFEDDVMIRKDFTDKLPDILKVFDKLRLDVCLLSSLIQCHPSTLGNKLLYRDGSNEYYSYTDDVWGAHMYMLSRTYAERLINKYTLDWAINNRTKPFTSDWLITKDTKSRALLYPPLGIEEGKVATDDIAQINFHKKCFDYLHNSKIHF